MPATAQRRRPPAPCCSEALLRPSVSGEAAVKSVRGSAAAMLHPASSWAAQWLGWPCTTCTAAENDHATIRSAGHMRVFVPRTVLGAGTSDVHTSSRWRPVRSDSAPQQACCSQLQQAHATDMPACCRGLRSEAVTFVPALFAPRRRLWAHQLLVHRLRRHLLVGGLRRRRPGERAQGRGAECPRNASNLYMQSMPARDGAAAEQRRCRLTVSV